MRQRLPFLFALLVACSTGTNLFNEGAGGSDTTSNASATRGSGGDTTSVNTVTSTSQGGGPGPGPGPGPNSSSTGTGEGGAGPGPGGGTPSCAHDVCEAGAALVSNCDPCVTQICAQDPYCCTQMWDGICVGYVDDICQIDCFPIGMGPCGMQYPTSPVCSDDNGQCALAYDATQNSCLTLCHAGGGECLGAYNDVQNQTCQINPNQPLSCTSMQVQTGVCVCSQGCGSGPPCPSFQTCVNGGCI